MDALFGGLELGRLDDYRKLLSAQAAAHLPVEAALDAGKAERVLPDWPSRRRGALLRADLGELGLPEPAPLSSPIFHNEEAILGAIYVLEGSRLGGAVLEASLPPGAPRRFLTARQQPGAWRSLLSLLDDRLAEHRKAERATDAARQVFSCFEAAARFHLKHAPA